MTSGTGPPAHPVTFEQLVRDHSAAAYRVARAIVRDHYLAEDVAQDALINAWRALPRFRGESSLRTWVLRIAHNTAISTLRRRREELVPDWSLPAAADGDSADKAQDSIMMEQFVKSLDRLSPASRAMVVLRELEGLSYNDIAIALEVPVTTVRTRLFRARRELARSMEGWQ
jgi:RNA polymerase sigma-70 factor (ECF subfamily)